MKAKARQAILVSVTVVGICIALLVHAADGPSATLRSEIAIDQQAPAPKMYGLDDSDRRQSRNYPEQPPIIPHDITAYRIDLNSNKCLTCHARSRTGDSGAPMVSITHFMDRDNQIRAAVTPRRYFCTQCHVPQHLVTPLVNNTFVDIDEVLQEKIK